tara:strand:+ start:962 stop:1843 length:882 start_codon:yes stop_codon:yes gene_type:complete
MSLKNSSITVVLNGYKRQKFLNYQINAVKNQTIPPNEILIWNNGSYIDSRDFDKNIFIANSSKNFGVWSRFTFALNAETEYICVLDDDTMPGKRFFENCLSTMQISPGLIGARGLKFLSKNKYQPHKSFGWDNPNEELKVVDIVGHAWFFKKEWLCYFWRELPLSNSSRLVGEDIHFSYTLQKYAGIKTIVPPHPLQNKDFWGSDPVLALRLGMGIESISQNNGALDKFDKVLSIYTSAGFVLNKEENNEKHLVIGPGIARFAIIRKIAYRFPIVRKLGKNLKSFLASRHIHI